MLLSVFKLKMYIGRSYIRGSFSINREESSLEFFMGAFMVVLERT